MIEGFFECRLWHVFVPNHAIGTKGFVVHFLMVDDLTHVHRSVEALAATEFVVLMSFYYMTRQSNRVNRGERAVSTSALKCATSFPPARAVSCSKR